MHSSLPNGVSLRERPGQRELVVRWRSVAHPLQFGLTGCFAALCCFAALRPFGPKLAFPPYRVLVAATGLFLCYFLLVQLLNATVVFVENDLLWSKRGPLPWAGRVKLELAAVEAVGFQTMSGVVVTMHYEQQRTLIESEYGGSEEIAALVAELIGKPLADVKSA